MLPHEVSARNVFNGVIWEANKWDEWENMSDKKPWKEANVDVNATSVVERGSEKEKVDRQPLIWGREGEICSHKQSGPRREVVRVKVNSSELSNLIFQEPWLHSAMCTGQCHTQWQATNILLNNLKVSGWFVRSEISWIKVCPSSIP